MRLNPARQSWRWLWLVWALLTFFPLLAAGVADVWGRVLGCSVVVGRACPAALEGLGGVVTWTRGSLSWGFGVLGVWVVWRLVVVVVRRLR